MSVDFQHSKCVDEKFSVITNCTFIDEEGISIGTGSAKCMRADQFVKATGRKIAMTRAMPSNFTKEQRKEVWEQYWQTVGF